MKNRYGDIKNKPSKMFGTCPKCQSDNLKIMYGWQGVYYDLICENNHDLRYDFNNKEVLIT